MSPLRSIVACSVLLAAVGCAGTDNRVVFVTKTSLGIDVESTMPGASLAYDRLEGYVGPRYHDGTVPTVAGAFSSNGALLGGRQIKQTYATGNAARLVTEAPVSHFPPTPPDAEPHNTMFFGTGTVLGVKLGFGPVGPDSFTLGYKRKELSVIPIGDKRRFPSVLAMLDNDVQPAQDATGSKLGLQQFFATGDAADWLAQDPGIRDHFKTKARDALAQFNADEREQKTLALETLYCFGQLDDAQLVKVWDNAERLALFDSSETTSKLRAVPAREARSLYTREIALVEAKSGLKTGLRRGHRVHVCDLATR